MTLNDFKAIDGDIAVGIRTLPVQMGPERAAKFACLVMITPQLGVLWLLATWGHIVAAGLVAVLIAGQLLAMLRFLTNPRRLAPWYNGVGVTQYVAGMMVSALAMGGHFG